MGIIVKGMIKSVALRTKGKSQTNEMFAITDITNQYFRKLLKNFNNSPYLVYK